MNTQIDDYFIIRKIQENALIKRFKVSKFICFFAGGLALIATLYMGVTGLASGAMAYNKDAIIVAEIAAMAISMFIVFSSLLLGAQYSYTIKKATTEDAEAYYGNCTMKLVNVVSMNKRAKSNGNVYFIKYSFRSKGYNIQVDKDTFESLHEGDECYILSCPHRIRNSAIISMRDWVYKKENTTYKANIHVIDSRENISKYR